MQDQLSPPEPFVATFHIDRLPYQVWESFTVPEDCGANLLVPGFPTDERGATGCRAMLIRRERRHGFVCRKLDDPDKGREISVEVGPANASGWPTRVTVSLAPDPDPLYGHDLLTAASWAQGVVDLRIFLERGIGLPATVSGVELGAQFRECELGLEVAQVDEGGLADTCGLQPGDLVINLAEARVLGSAQLLAICATLSGRTEAKIVWLRAKELHESVLALSESG